jgi:asparagine synthase (glutamine-hydrolysing)
VGPAWSAYVDAARERLGGGLARRPKDRFADTVWGMTTYDFGNQRKGTLAGWGLDERDPTADRRLTEFCLSLPTEMLLKNGVRRPLAHAALSDRLPAAVLDERSKGYQAADWYEGLSADRATIAGMVDAIATSPPAAAVVDVEALRGWLRDWPSAGWDEPTVMARYRSALLGALSAGMFAVAADGGVS